MEASFFAWFAAGFSCGDAPTSGSTEARLGHSLNPAAYVADPDIESFSSFSQITSVVGTPRLIQFALKYSF